MLSYANKLKKIRLERKIQGDIMKYKFGQVLTSLFGNVVLFLGTYKSGKKLMGMNVDDYLIWSPSVGLRFIPSGMSMNTAGGVKALLERETGNEVFLHMPFGQPEDFMEIHEKLKQKDVIDHLKTSFDQIVENRIMFIF